MPDTALMAIGCYTETMPHVTGKGDGIAIVALDTVHGTLTYRHVVKGPRNPSYLAISNTGDRLYAVEELGEEAGPQTHTYALDRATGEMELLSKVPSPGAAACHIVTDKQGKFLFISNFVSGDLLCYRLDVDGVPEPTPQVIGRPGNGTARMHFAREIADGMVVVCDAGNDRVAGYRLDADGLRPESAFEIAAPAGSFPRHLAMLPGGDAGLVVHELASSLGLIRFGADGGSYGDIVSSLPPGWGGSNTGAAVRVHPNGRFGYMSNRGHDSIFGAAISATGGLSPIGAWASGGTTPRDFTFDPSGRWLIAAHQSSDNLTVFPVNGETGVLGERSHQLTTGTPVSVLFL